MFIAHPIVPKSAQERLITSPEWRDLMVHLGHVVEGAAPCKECDRAQFARVGWPIWTVAEDDHWPMMCEQGRCLARAYGAVFKKWMS